MTIAISMRWEPNLAAGPPRVRPEVQDWQEDLAVELESSIAHMRWDFELGPQVIVDVEMFFPLGDGQKRADNYLKAILEGVAAGAGIAMSNCIPIVRRVQYVPESDAGFLIRVYPTDLAGHGLTGHIEQQPGPTGQMIIVLDDDLPVEMIGSRVKINVGVIHNAQP